MERYPRNMTHENKTIGTQQKLKTVSKFYCQLCKVGSDDFQKFRTHLVSRQHLLQKQVYDAHPAPYTEHYSNKFVCQFVNVLKHRYGTEAVSASRLYLNHLEDPKNVRLTSTKWVAFDEFLQWLQNEYKDKDASHKVPP